MSFVSFIYEYIGSDSGYSSSKSRRVFGGGGTRDRTSIKRWKSENIDGWTEVKERKRNNKMGHKRRDFLD